MLEDYDNASTFAMQVWQGAIAGSAPILTFEGEHPPVDPLFYSKTVTFDTTPAAGAPDGCTTALRSAFGVLTGLIEAERGASDGSRSTADKIASVRNRGFDTATVSLRICPGVKLNNTDDVAGVRDWASAAFDMMAMGQYPYPSSYMLNGNGELPAFPVRVACTKMLGVLRASVEQDSAQRTASEDVVAAYATDPAAAAASKLRSIDRKLLSDADDTSRQIDSYSPQALLSGLAEAVGVWYNYTGALSLRLSTFV